MVCVQGREVSEFERARSHVVSWDTAYPCAWRSHDAEFVRLRAQVCVVGTLHTRVHGAHIGPFMVQGWLSS